MKRNYWKVKARYFQHLLNMERLQKMAEQSQSQYNEILKEEGLNPSIEYDFDDGMEKIVAKNKPKKVENIKKKELEIKENQNA